jgi:hypothetical protein
MREPDGSRQLPAPGAVVSNSTQSRSPLTCTNANSTDRNSDSRALKPPGKRAALVSLAFLVRRAVRELELVGTQVRHDDAVEVAPQALELAGQVRDRLIQPGKLRAVIDMTVQQDCASPGPSGPRMRGPVSWTAR